MFHLRSLKKYMATGAAAAAMGLGSVSCCDEALKSRFGDDYLHVPFRSRADYSDHFMYKTLSGPKKFEKYEFFTKVEGEPELRTLVHIGKEMCGHSGITHGGAIASIFDDCFGALVFSLKLGVAFTANLNIDYRKPLFADNEVVFVGTVDKIEGKKIWVKGRLEDPTGKTVYTEGKALFILKNIPSGLARFEAVHKSVSELKASVKKRFQKAEQLYIR